MHLEKDIGTKKSHKVPPKQEMELGKKKQAKRRGENITNSKKKTNVEFTGIYLQTHLSLFLRLPIGVDKKGGSMLKEFCL